MKSIPLSLFALALTVLFASSPVRAEEQETDIPLADMPQAIMNAAMVAVPGIVVSEAEIKSTEAGDVYELDGEAEGKEYEIQIARDGTVLSVEMDDDEHEDHDGDKDDDDSHDNDDDHHHDKDATTTDVKKDNG